MSKRENGLTHFDARGQARMVDVAAKDETHRIAVARGRMRMLPATALRGAGAAFVVEADEYAGNFDAYQPSIAIVTLQSGKGSTLTTTLNAWLSITLVGA